MIRLPFKCVEKSFISVRGVQVCEIYNNFTEENVANRFNNIIIIPIFLSPYQPTIKLGQALFIYMNLFI